MLAAVFIFIGITMSAYFAVYMSVRRKRSSLKNRLDSYKPRASAAKDKSGKKGQSIFGSIDKSLRGRSVASYIKHELNRANWSLKVSEFIVIVILSASLVPLLVLLFTDNKTLTLVLVGAGASFPFFYLKKRQAARRKLFAEQLLDAVTLISNSLKSGYSFLQSVDLVARELAPPISEEFQKVLQEIKLGISFEQAVNGLVERADNDDLDLVMTSVNIQREVGGNLSEVLDKIAHTIRERVRIKGQIRTLTAQGRLSGTILSLLPVALGIFLFIINPDYISMLFKQPAGRIMVGFAAIMQMIGMLLIRKIVDIKV